MLKCKLSLQDPLEFPANELQKHFKVGDHVKVIAGRYEGDTGLIIRVEDNAAVLFSDLTMHEVPTKYLTILLQYLDGEKVFYMQFVMFV